jgi:hypothetical protein
MIPLITITLFNGSVLQIIMKICILNIPIFIITLRGSKLPFDPCEGIFVPFYFKGDETIYFLFVLFSTFYFVFYKRMVFEGTLVHSTYSKPGDRCQPRSGSA